MTDRPVDESAAPTTPVAVLSPSPSSIDPANVDAGLVDTGPVDKGSIGTGSSPVAPTPPRRRIWHAIDDGPKAKPWRVLSIVLLVIGCVLAPIGVTTAWAKNLVTSQEAYLEAVSPLVTDPVIVNAAEARLVAGIDTAISNLQLADKIGDELESLGLPPRLASLATGYLATFRTDITDAITKMVDELFQSPKLAEIWNQANAKSHTVFVQIMQGDNLGRLNSINVDLSSAVTSVKQKLENSGVQWASQIPDIPIVFNLAGNADVQQIAGYYDTLVTLGTWLPIIALVLLLLSIVIAPSRLGGLSKAAGWLAFSMVVLVVGLLVARQWLVSNAPSQPDVTQAFTRQLTVNLQGTIRFVLVLSAVISVLAWMFGRSRSARAVRGTVRGLAGRVQDSRWQWVVRIGAGVIALVLVLVLVSLDDPGLVAALVLAALAGLFALVAASPGGPSATVREEPVDQVAAPVGG